MNKEKFDYIHNITVQSGLVTEPGEWKHSSARNYAQIGCCVAGVI